MRKGTIANDATAAGEPRLHFSQTWEDPETDAHALAIRPGDVVIAISAAGCTPLRLLAEDPGRLVSVDSNPAQSHLLALKVAAMRQLDAAGFEAFFDRGAAFLRTYDQLRDGLADDARAWWDRNTGLLESGSAGAGVATAFIHRIGRWLREDLFRRAPLAELFGLSSLAEQRVFFDRHLRRRWIDLLAVVLDPAVSTRSVLRAILPGDYFPYATSRGVLRWLWRRFEHTATLVPAADNYFLARLLLGMDRAAAVARPTLLRPAVYAGVQARLDRLEVVTTPLEVYLRSLPDRSVDAFQLSNIFEWMAAPRLAEVFAEVHRVARPGARLVFRNLFTTRSIPPALSGAFHIDEGLCERLLFADRSILYARCCAATAMRV